MKLLKYWIEQTSWSTVGDATVSQTTAAIRRAFSTIESCSGYRFTEVDSRSKARIDLTFHGNDEVMRSGSGYAFGKASTNGWVRLNNERKVTSIIDRHIIEGLVMHEFLHTQRWKHSDDKTSIMHPWLTSYHLSPADIRRLQKETGSPEKPFHPSSRVFAGAKIRRIQQKLTEMEQTRDELIERRTRYIETGLWKPNHPLQANILKLNGPGGSIYRTYVELGNASKAWHVENKRWKGFPHAIQI